MEKNVLLGFFEKLEKLAESIIGVSYIGVIKDGKILLGQRRDNHKWTNPGGHLEGDETPVLGAVRELKEEAGIEAKPEQLKHLLTRVVTKPDGKKLRVSAFRLDLNRDKPTTIKEDPDEEVYRWHWITPETLFSDDVWKKLHVPAEDNVLLKGLGLVK